MTERTRKHEAADCEECPLYPGKFVPSKIPQGAKQIFVGEAPGHYETVEKQPFVGLSGRLLNAVLEQHGIDRKDVATTNTVLCRPPNNRTPTKLEVKCCAPRLKAEIDSLNPETIVPLGGTASSAIMGKSVKITQLRAGPPKTSELYPQAEIVPSFHPAACLRSSDYYPSLVTDIGKIKRDGKERLEWTEPQFRVFSDATSATTALEQLLKSYDTFVFDIETGAEKDAEFEHANMQRLLCVGIAYARGKAIVIAEEALSDQRVRELLSELLSKQVIAHNAKFDLSGLARFNPNAKTYFDTMLASYVVDERGGTHGLKYLAKELLGTPDYEADIKEYVKGKDADYGNIPTDKLHKYNAYDVACTWLLYEHYSRIFTDTDWKLHSFLCLASDQIMHLEMGGVKVDEDYLEDLEVKFKADLDERETQLTRWVDNPRSPMQVKASLSKLGANVDSTDADTLTKLVEVAKPESDLTAFCEALLGYRKQQKLASTYIAGIRNRIKNGRVYPTFLLHGTTTGRLSCRNPNLQNIPRGSAIRSLFVPAAGNVFVQADYSQAELRTVAALANDEYLQGVFSEGRDIHGEVAERFFGPGWTKEQRVKAKMVVFGLTYAMTAHGLSGRMNIPLTEAQRYQKEFFDVIPQVVEWRESVKEQLLNSEHDLETPFGRRRRYGLITNDNKEEIIKEGTAFLPQSIASDICLTALCNIRQAFADPQHIYHRAQVRLPVHDSIMVECPVEDAEGVAAFMVSEMEAAGRVFTTFVPYAVDVSISEKSWGDL